MMVAVSCVCVFKISVFSVAFGIDRLQNYTQVLIFIVFSASVLEILRRFVDGLQDFCEPSGIEWQVLLASSFCPSESPWHPLDSQEDTC